MEINWFAILLAGLAGILIGAIWFGPKTFFPIWWKFMGRSQDDQAAGSAGPIVSFGLTFLAAFIQAMALALILELAQAAMTEVTVWDGLAIGALVGFGFAAAPSLGHKLFGGLSLRAWVIEVGQDIVGLAAMGAIIAAMG